MAAGVTRVLAVGFSVLLLTKPSLKTVVWPKAASGAVSAARRVIKGKVFMGFNGDDEFSSDELSCADATKERGCRRPGRWRQTTIALAIAEINQHGDTATIATCPAGLNPI